MSAVAKLLTECPDVEVVGHCAACHKPVLAADAPVWECPANLSEGNPHKREPAVKITEEMQQKAGVFSFCGNDFGMPCHEDMPLHGACYEGGEFTW